MSHTDGDLAMVLGLVQELDDDGEGLTSWEVNFVESMLGQLEAGRRLTEKQLATLERIREERLP